MKSLVRTVVLAVALTTDCQGQNESDDFAPQFKEIEKLSKELQDLHKLSQALDICRRILKKAPHQFEAMVNACRICWRIGVQLESKEKAKEMFEVGFEHAERLKEKYPDKPDGYYWYAVNYGEHVKRSSIFAKIGGYDRIMNHAKKTLKIDPSYDLGGAYLIVGRINQMTPGGSDQLAEEYYLKAIQYAPCRTTGHLYLGELYFNQKKYENSLREMEIVLNGPHEARFSIEQKLDTPTANEWLVKILEKIKKNK